MLKTKNNFKMPVWDITTLWKCVCVLGLIVNKLWKIFFQKFIHIFKKAISKTILGYEWLHPQNRWFSLLLAIMPSMSLWYCGTTGWFSSQQFHIHSSPLVALIAHKNQNHHVNHHGICTEPPVFIHLAIFKKLVIFKLLCLVYRFIFLCQFASCHINVLDIFEREVQLL